MSGYVSDVLRAMRYVLGADCCAFADVESAIKEYMWAIGSNRSSVDDIQPFVSIGLDTAAMATGLALWPGQTVYVSVMARNSAGLGTVLMSNGFHVASNLGSVSPVPEIDASGWCLVPSQSKASTTRLAPTECE